MRFFFIPLIMGIVFCDQLIKYYVMHHLYLGQSIVIIPGICNLTYILNSGAAFGIMQNQQLFFIFIALILILLMIYYRKRISQFSILTQFGIACLVGGAIGNMIDRLSRGQVVDYIDLLVWPIFNLADICIVLGCIILLIKTIFSKEYNQ